MKDVAIIGGGPAGTSAALEARRQGLDAVVFERERFPRPKVCGEFLSAESLPLLERAIPAALGRAATISAAEFVSPHGRRFSFSLPRPARGLSRELLDEALWRAAGEAGAELREGEAVRRVERTRGKSWIVETMDGGVCEARALALACGRWWKLDGLSSPAEEQAQGGDAAWMGVKAHFRGVTVRDAVEMYYFPGGYCGLAPIEGGAYNACCLVHRRVVPLPTGGIADFAAWIAAVASHTALDERLRGAVQVGKTVATAPLFLSERSEERSGALAVGDAAGFLDPFTGDGIAMALKSGKLAARKIAAGLARRNGEPQDWGGSYRLELARAMGRSYGIAGLLRNLVCAREAVQTAAAAALPWFGPRIFNATRWRDSQFNEARTED